MQLWITFLLGGPCYVFLFVLIWGLILENRWTKIPRWFPPLLFAIVLSPTMYLRATNSADSLLFQCLEFIHIGSMLTYLIWMFRDPLWRKVLALILNYSLTLVGQELTLPLMDSMKINFNEDLSTPSMFYFYSVGSCINLCLFAIVAVIWRRIMFKSRLSNKAWLFLLFPISQMFLLWNVQAKYKDGIYIYNGNIYVILGVIIGFIADIILLYMVLTQGEKEEMACRLQETEYLRKVEEVHYQSIEARREELAKVRHDFNNQLTTALLLTLQGNAELAQTQLEQLQSQVSHTKEYIWCANPVVNAVLTEKTKECTAVEVPIEVEVTLDETCNIEPIRLCSAFTNLLDNAIHAARNYEKQRRFIRLRCVQDGDYIHIKVENSASKPPYKRLPTKGHGYGQQILKEIAQRYHGELHTNWREDIYSAVLSLENPQYAKSK